MSWLTWISWGSFFAGTGVGLGAFAAHALKTKLTPKDLEIFETAVRYQMYHAFALLALGFVASRIDHNLLKTSGVFFVLGTFVFSGSLYALVMLDKRWLGMVTPFGGSLLIIGWLLLFICCLMNH